MGIGLQTFECSTTEWLLISGGVLFFSSFSSKISHFILELFRLESLNKSYKSTTDKKIVGDEESQIDQSNSWKNANFSNLELKLKIFPIASTVLFVIIQGVVNATTHSSHQCPYAYNFENPLEISPYQVPFDIFLVIIEFIIIPLLLCILLKRNKAHPQTSVIVIKLIFMLLSIILYGVWVLFIIPNSTTQIAGRYIRPILWLFIPHVFSHGLSVILPVLVLYKVGRTSATGSYEYSDFISDLKDPIARTLMKQIAEELFCVENMLFIEEFYDLQGKINKAFMAHHEESPTDIDRKTTEGGNKEAGHQTLNNAEPTKIRADSITTTPRQSIASRTRRLSSYLGKLANKLERIDEKPFEAPRDFPLDDGFNRKSQIIFQKYVERRSPRELNLSDTVRQPVSQIYNSKLTPKPPITAGTLDEVSKEVRTMIFQTIYPVFQERIHENGKKKPESDTQKSGSSKYSKPVAPESSFEDMFQVGRSNRI